MGTRISESTGLYGSRTGESTLCGALGCGRIRFTRIRGRCAESDVIGHGNQTKDSAAHRERGN
ncbi:MAG: hypothetical protein ABSD31_03115 [Candidatus Binataceae bacterium]